jgi:hypothetical protein
MELAWFDELTLHIGRIKALFLKVHVS